jgi:hypothetical protein
MSQRKPKLELVTTKTVAADGGGLRYNNGKARFDLVPPEFELAVAEHYRRGGMKYLPRNWERGMSWMACAASLRRHYNAWMLGEDYDPETGSHHMIGVAWNAIALFVYFVRGIGADDRVKAARKNDLFLPVPAALQALEDKKVAA